MLEHLRDAQIFQLWNDNISRGEVTLLLFINARDVLFGATPNALKSDLNVKSLIRQLGFNKLFLIKS